jgi:predicted RNase H-like HicB family nuclease
MLEQDAADDWVVGARDLPEAQTSGATRDETLALAADAIAVAVARRMRDGDAFPPADPGPSRRDQRRATPADCR